MGEIRKALKSTTPGRVAVAMGPQHQKQQRADWAREYASLRKLAVRLDSEVHHGFLSTCSDLQQYAQALLEQQKSATDARRRDTEGFQKRLRMHKMMMSKIKLEAKRLSEGATVSADVDGIMGGLEDDLYEFKCKMRKDDDQLDQEEKRLSVEMADLNNKLAGWEKRADDGNVPKMSARRPPPPPPPVAAAQRAAAKKKSSEESGVPFEGTAEGLASAPTTPDNLRRDPENRENNGEDKGVSTCGKDSRETGDAKGYGDAVERINALIMREGGRTGGWPAHEHECFLRLWTKVKRGPSRGARPPSSSPADRAAVASLVHRASTLLPTRNIEEVREHLAWHGRYQVYLEEKKEAARDWRRERQEQQEQQEQRRQETETVEQTSGVFGSKGNRDKERQAAARDRERKKKEVEEWRALREKKEQTQATEDVREQEVEEAKADEAKRQQRRTHAKIAAFRLQREREDNRRKEVERMLAQEQRIHSQADLAERVRQDVDVARQRRQAATNKEYERRELQEKKKANATKRWASVAADRTRLLGATKASKERGLNPEDLDEMEDARASLPAHCSRVANSGRDLRFVGRAVPCWRQGVL